MEKIIGCEKRDEVLKELTEISFGAAVAPWIEVARAELKEKMPQVPSMISKGAMRALERELIERFSELCTPAFVLEMHIVKMERGLDGETSEARYGDYVKRYLEDADYLRMFFKEYRVLQEWVNVALRLWVNKVAEFCERFETDYNELRRRFGRGTALGCLEEVKPGLSDPHNGNQSVYELVFESGVSIFYKPKSLGIDVVFNAFLLEMNGMGLSPDLKAFRAWDRTSYGWVEKIEHLPCKDEVEVEDYFTRAGMLLCLFYLFGGTDIHHENLIANGPYPAIVDLESLFHPNLNSQEVLDDPKAWKQSVLRVGMLPNFMLGEIGLAGIDISGLGGQGEQKVPGFAPRWDGLDSDEMRLTYFQPTTQAGKNAVRVGDKDYAANDYLDVIVSGFEKMYLFIKERKELLLGAGGWLDRFAQCPVRCICRPTRLYFKLLQQLLDPTRLRDEAAHKEILDILPRYMLENGNEHLAPVVEEEKRAMEQRDIPFFQTLPKSRDLYLNGEVIIEDVLEECTYDAARELLEEMSEEKRLEQVDLIEQSFYAFDYTKKGARRGEESVVPMAVTDAILLDEALKQGHILLEKGRRDRKGGLRWIGIEYLPAEEQAVLAALSRSLYGGTLGLSLFFGALHWVTGNLLWKEATEASLQPFCDTLEGDGVERMPGALGLGGMTGVGSFMYALGHIAELIGEAKYREKALFLTTLVKDKHIAEDAQFDVISGGAGFILALLSLHRKTQEASLLEWAKKMGDHLVASAHREEVGVSWPQRGRRGLLGFSHGAAGIAFALEKLAMATRQDHYLRAADQAIAYERSHFSKEARNWPDFRGKEPNLLALSWCHGAPGVGLGRVCSPRFKKQPEMLQEIKHAACSTKEGFKQMTHHLCCGDLGRAEILATMGQRTGDAALCFYAREKISAVVQQARSQGYYSLNALLPPGVFSPGFMQGLSGIGYTFLRNIKGGKNLPNVLILE